MPHFLMAPVGSSGDVHPFIGIGRALRARGHDVTVVTSEPFRAVTEGAGLRFHQTHSSEDFDRITRHPDLWHPRKGMALVMEQTARVIRIDYERIAEAFEPGRTVLVGHTLALAARVFEEKHQVPAATLHLAPSVFRSDFQQPATFPGRDLSGLPRWAKRAAWWLIDRMLIDPSITPDLNRFRRELGLPPVHRVFHEWIHSPRCVVALFPPWFAPPQPDWPAALRMTGFPLFDESAQWTPSPSLERFLAAGDPPVVFTPGSANRLAAPFFQAAVDAAAILDRRALLLTRYPEQLPKDLPESVHHEAYVPLSHLLPHCAALVHHGGIGTCAQGLAAGIPQLTMPLGFDQPDNTTRLLRLGVGRWVLPAQFTGPRVADALRGLLGSAAVRAACRMWSEVMKKSSPVEETCELLERAMS